MISIQMTCVGVTSRIFLNVVGSQVSSLGSFSRIFLNVVMGLALLTILSACRSALALLCRRLEEEDVPFTTSTMSNRGTGGVVDGVSETAPVARGVGFGVDEGERLIDVVRRQEHFVASLGGLVADVRRRSSTQRNLQVEQLR